MYILSVVVDIRTYIRRYSVYELGMYIRTYI